MSTDHNIADRILNATLAQVRQTRAQRRTRRIALGSGALALLALTFALRPAPLSVPVPPLPAISAVTGEPPVDDTLVVMVWHNGSARLEEYDVEKLGAMDLQFNLEPVIACPEGEWLKPF